MICLVLHTRFKSRQEFRCQPTLQGMGCKSTKRNPQPTEKTTKKEETSPLDPLDINAYLRLNDRTLKGGIPNP